MHNLGLSSAKRTPFETDTIPVKETGPFEQLSKRPPFFEEQLLMLNPEHKSKIIPYEQNKEHPLPELIIAPERVRYSAQPGDAFSLIARRYGVQGSQIKTWNNLKDNTIRADERLTVYSKRYPKS